MSSTAPERAARRPSQSTPSNTAAHCGRRATKQTRPQENTVTEAFDLAIDTQWAKDGVNPVEYAKEPWKHFREAHNAFLSIRMSKREAFRTNIDGETRKRVDHEIDRIKQTRANFSNYDNKKELLAQLHTSRQAWKEQVEKNMGKYIEEHKKKASPDPEEGKTHRAEAETLPKGSSRYKELIDKANMCDRYFWDASLFERFSKEAWKKEWKEETSTNEHLPDPKVVELYGLKAGVIYFKRKEPGSDWLGHTVDNNSLLSGNKFPNQKILMHDLLNQPTGDLIGSPCDEKTIRWFHFPTNNMEWVETAIKKYYEQQKPGGSHEPNRASPAEKLLSREYWRGQMHGTGNKGPLGHETTIEGPIHARHMRSRCSIIPRDPHHHHDREAEPPAAPLENGYVPNRIPNGKNLAFFLPYLHWETSRRRAKMVEVVNEVIKPKGIKKHLSTVVRERLPMKSNTPRRTLLGEYLMKIAEVADQMDYEADERLLRDNITRDPPLHMRRTLDQYYFLALEDTSARDRDQVVYRGTKAGQSFHTRNTRVVMVDQLWLWILDDQTIISCFPRRWGRNKPDPSGVHKSLRERLKDMAERNEGIKSIHHLAVIIIDQCSRVFFDRTRALDERPEVMDLFASAVGHITQYASIAYDSFWRNTRLYSSGMLFDNQFRYLDINPEGVLLQEAQDIAEELKIMLRIYTEQGAVVKEFRRYLGHLNGELKGDIAIMHRLIEAVERYHPHEAQTDHSASNFRRRPQRQSWLDDTIDHADVLLEEIQNRKMEIQNLEESALRTQHQLESLLQLKQQQTSIIEAKTAIQQGRAIMAFTVVTICFLPLGFFAAFFGMNNNDINQATWMSLKQQITYMFSLSAVVIAVSVTFAFRRVSSALSRVGPALVSWLQALTKMLVLGFGYVVKHTGIRKAGQSGQSTRLYHETLWKRNRTASDQISMPRHERKEEEQSEILCPSDDMNSTFNGVQKCDQNGSGNSTVIDDGKGGPTTSEFEGEVGRLPSLWRRLRKRGTVEKERV